MHRLGPAVNAAVPRLVSVCIWVLLPLATVAYQIAAKQVSSCGGSTSAPRQWLACVLHTPWSAAMVVSDIAGFVAWMLVLGRMTLSAAFPLSALSYVLVIAASWTVFREQASPAQLVGSVLIMAGVFLLGRGEPPEKLTNA